MDFDLVELLYDRHWSRVEQRCRRILRDPEEAADAAQEVFMQLIRRGTEFRGEAKWMTWLYRVATNVSLNRIRSRRRQQLRPSPTKPTPVEAAHTTEDALVARNAVASILGHFDDTTLQAALLHYVAERNQSEIGEMLSLSRVAINRRLARFRDRSRALLEQRPDPPSLCAAS